MERINAQAAAGALAGYRLHAPVLGPQVHEAVVRAACRLVVVQPILAKVRRALVQAVRWVHLGDIPVLQVQQLASSVRLIRLLCPAVEELAHAHPCVRQPPHDTARCAVVHRHLVGAEVLFHVLGVELAPPTTAALVFLPWYRCHPVSHHPPLCRQLRDVDQHGAVWQHVPRPKLRHGQGCAVFARYLGHGVVAATNPCVGQVRKLQAKRTALPAWLPAAHCGWRTAAAQPAATAARLT
jgi:hypothetical protein